MGGGVAVECEGISSGIILDRGLKEGQGGNQESGTIQGQGKNKL